MKAKIISLFTHELIKGSVLVFFGNMLANVLNYLFHLITGRLLGPEQYAIIAALLSLFYIINFSSTILNIVVTRKIAALSAKKDYSSIKGFTLFMAKNAFVLSMVIIAFFLLFQEQIADFLKIDNPFLIVLLGISFCLGLFFVINLGVLQGLLRFTEFSIVFVCSSLFRDISAILAIVFGLGVLGIVWGMVITVIISIVIALYYLRFLFGVTATTHRFHIRSYLRTVWVAGGLLGMALMLNSDVLLVKHFFSSFDAGLYAALATMGKIVFFASSSIAIVLLPLIAKKKEAGVSGKKDLLLSLGIVLLISLGVIVIYILFPRLMLTLLYGTRYISVASYLWLIGIYFLFYNLSYILVNYYISLYKKGILLVPLVFAVFEIGFIFLFHQSFLQVLTIMIASSALLFAILWVYYLKNER